MPSSQLLSKIFTAAETGDLALLQQCLAGGVPVDTPDQRKSPNGVPTKLTPLMWACRTGNVSAASACCHGMASFDGSVSVRASALLPRMCAHLSRPGVGAIYIRVYAT